MGQQRWKYEAFMQFYEAWNNFFVRTDLEIFLDAYNGFLQSTEWNELPLEAQDVASIFLDANEKETDELPFLLEKAEAQDRYLALCRENYPVGREIPPETLAYWEEQFAEKEFSTLIAPLGHQSRYSGVLRKKAGPEILLFPFFADRLDSSRYLLSLVAKTMLERDLPVAEWISFQHLYEREAVAAGLERTAITLQLEQLMNGRLEMVLTDTQKKALLLQRVLFHFRAEQPEAPYIQWEESTYRQTGISLNLLANFLDQSHLELESEEWAVCCWIRFVILRSRGFEEAVKQAQLVLANATVLRKIDAFSFLGGLPTVPIDRQYKDVVLRRLQDDFQEITVSFLLDHFVAHKDYLQGYRLLDSHDRFFQAFLPAYREAAGGEDAEASVKELFHAQQERLRVVLGENWLTRVKETHKEERAVGSTASRDAFQWGVKYIYNVMSTFHAVEEEELGVFMNKIYLHLMMPE